MRKAFSMKLTAAAIAGALAISPALAQTTGGTATLTAPPTTSTTTTAGSKLSNNFSAWAGSPENSAALVNGLRTGQPITLSSAPATGGTGSTGGVPTTTTTTFTPPTKPMGYGNVRIALSLAQQQLASQGITQPTPQQLQTALMGGPLTTTNGTTAQTTDMQGVLQMRADGMGWGKIANTMGYKLGAVMSGKAAATPTTTTSSGSGITTAGAGSTKVQHGKTSSGITTAAGGTAGAGSTKTQHGKAGSGIVTASGGAGGGITTGMGGGHGNAGGAGVVTAHGGGGVQGQGHGGGQGKGGK